MGRNKKISVVIPTYNRGDLLDILLRVHIPMFREFGVGVHISDNFSSDNTAAVVEKWCREYPFINYHCNQSNVGADRNFEIALSLPDTDYVWLLGDSYRLPENGIKTILELVSNKAYDAVVVNLAGRLPLSARDYNEGGELLADIGGLMSCLSCLIYSRDLILNASFSRYRGSYFIQTGIIFEYLSSRESCVRWEGGLSILGLSNEVFTKDSWANSRGVLKVGVESWVNFIFSLPPCYLFSSKVKAARSFGLLSVRRIFLMRAHGYLNFKEFLKYRHSFFFAVPGFLKLLFVFAICFCPVFILRGVVELVRSSKKYGIL